MEYTILILSNFIFSLTRTLNVRYTAKDKIIPSLITSTVIKITWLVGIYFGIKGLNTQDYTLLILWLISGVMGDRIAFMFKR
jgi:hypothetical protein